MDHLEERLPERLDANGDLPPPWSTVPLYSRYTLGWRMGGGEEVMLLFHSFLEGLRPDLETRLAYLKRHPAAPYTWADWIDGVILHRHDRRTNWDLKDPVVRERQNWQIEQGVIASDIAYPTWLSQQGGRLSLPWDKGDTPEQTALSLTRMFAFQSRQLHESEEKPPLPPPRWQLPDDILPERGLLCLASQLLKGKVRAPWEMGLEPADFRETVDKGMGFVDAFRLWTNSAFDDAAHYQRYLDSTGGVPAQWQPWIQAHAMPKS